MNAAPAILFDLDDTLISAYRNPRAAWLAIAREIAETRPDFPAEIVADAVATRAKRFFLDEVNRRLWRLEPVETRRSVARAAFEELEESGLMLPDALAMRMADRYESYRDENMFLLPGVHDVLETLRGRGFRLGLLTNGSSRVQRGKIARFDLDERFDHIQIEEEAGIGKPEEAAYLMALERLGSAPERAWMVGDDLDWDVATPLRLGLRAAWYDHEGRGLPPGANASAVFRLHEELLALPGK